MKKRPGSNDVELSDEDYASLLEFRDGLRRFLSWSQKQAKDAGMTASQHQLLLVVRGHGESPSVKEVARHLLLRHHSAVELVDRSERAGLVRRVPDPTDHRSVRVILTEHGDQQLSRLASAHLEELSRIGPRLTRLWRRLPSSSAEAADDARAR